MNLKFATFALVFLAQGVANAEYGSRIAACATLQSQKNHYEVFQTYLGPNSYSYFLRIDTGTPNGVGLIGPAEQADFNLAKTELTLDFGGMGVILNKGIDQSGIVRGLLVPDEQIACTADWQ